MSKVMIFSSDGHAAAPLEGYRPYLEEAYLPAFEETVRAAAQVTVDFEQVHDPDTIGPWKRAFVDSGRIDARWDMDRRLHELESQGIVGEVLFPDGAPFGAGGIGELHPPFPRDQVRAGARAYNRWLADFVSPYNDRFAGLGIVVLGDVDEAIKDVRWAADHGLKGLMMPGVESDVPAFWDAIYEPFWSACAEAQLPLNFHGGIGLPQNVFASSDVPIGIRVRIVATEFVWYAHRPLWWLIWSGVLERHPTLRLVFTEQQTDWVPGLLRKLDHSWEHGRYASIKDTVPHPPSFYWHRQCYVGSSVLSKIDVDPDVRAEIGVDRMMFGADFPHPEGTATRTLQYLQATVGAASMSEGEARSFLGENAVEAFGLDAKRLNAIGNEHGPELGEVLTPLDKDVVMRKFRRTDVIRPPA